jgi:hypothetical protein
MKSLTSLLLMGNICAADRASVERSLFPCSNNSFLTPSKVRKYLPTITNVDGVALAPTADQMLPATVAFHVPAPVSDLLMGFGQK